MAENLQTASQQSKTPMVEKAIHNAANPLHFMRLKPCTRRIRVWRGETLLADTNRAFRLLEAGRDLYDPVYYFPSDEIRVELQKVADKSTHCPLKGDASYYTLADQEIGEGDYFAWAYEQPFEFAQGLKGLVAFNPDKVRSEEIGA